MSTSSAESSPTGRPGHTTYILSYTPERIRVVRRHHPLVGRSLPVVQEGRQQLVVRLPDGTTMRLPRAWTDADGEPPAAGSGWETFCTLGGLVELTDLIEALRTRARS